MQKFFVKLTFGTKGFIRHYLLILLMPKLMDKLKIVTEIVLKFNLNFVDVVRHWENEGLLCKKSDQAALEIGIDPKIYQRVTEVIANVLNKPKSDVTPEAHLKANLAADSFDIVDLMLKLETKFGCRFENQEVENVETVKDIMLLIQNKTKQK